MIYELRTYTVKQGTVPDVVKAAGTVWRDIRGDNYGKLEGYWVTEIGPLNQVMHLWSYTDLNERARLRGELAKNPRWTRRVHPADPAEPDPPGDAAAQRRGRARGAGADAQRLRAAQLSHQARRQQQWADLIASVLPVREKYSKIVGLWMTEAGQPNEACHIWAYPDLNARAAGARRRDEGPGLAGVPQRARRCSRRCTPPS